MSRPRGSTNGGGSGFFGLFGRRKDKKDKKGTGSGDVVVHSGADDNSQHKDSKDPGKPTTKPCYVTTFDDLNERAIKDIHKCKIDEDKVRENLELFVGCLGFLTDNQYRWLDPNKKKAKEASKLAQSGEDGSGILAADSTDGADKLAKSASGDRDKDKDKDKAHDDDDDDKDKDKEQRERDREARRARKQKEREEREHEREKEGGSDKDAEKGASDADVAAAKDKERKDKDAAKGKDGKNTSEREEKAFFDADPDADYIVITDSPKKYLKIGEQSGEGGFGVVFQAKDSVTKQRVAVKRVSNKGKRDQVTNAREVGALKFCAGNANIVGYFRTYLHTDNVWIVMEFMEGGTLTQAARATRFSESQVCYVSREMLKALEFLHSKNIVHRDLKSPNVMMSISGDIKLIDFGLAADVSKGPKRKLAGSPHWMPPEMIKKEEYKQEVDIWSFAVCVCELANGEGPSATATALKALFYTAVDGCPKPFKTEKDWTAPFIEFIKSCLTYDKSQRPSAATLLKHDVLKSSANAKSMSQVLTAVFLESALNF